MSEEIKEEIEALLSIYEDDMEGLFSIIFSRQNNKEIH